MQEFTSGVYWQEVMSLQPVERTVPELLLFSYHLFGLSKLLAIPVLLESSKQQVSGMVSVSVGLNFSSSPAFCLGHNLRYILAY